MHNNANNNANASPFLVNQDDPFFVDSVLFGVEQFAPMSEIKRIDEHNFHLNNNTNNNNNNFSALLNLDNSMNSARSLQSNQSGFSSVLLNNHTDIQNSHTNNANRGVPQQQRFESVDIIDQSISSSAPCFDKLEENLLHMAMYCNQTLKNFGFSGLGQFPSSRSEDAMQTLNVIYEVLQQRQKDIEFRTGIAEKTAKLENNYKISQEKNQKFQVEIGRMKKQIGGLENQLSTLEDRSKKEISRLTNERDEAQRNLIKLQQKSAHMVAEIRKKESETNRVKEQMKKLTADKFDKSSTTRNSIEITQSLSHHFQNNKSNPADEFVDTVNQQAITMNHTLLQENQAFRNTLMTLHNELNGFVKAAKEEYIRKKIKEDDTSVSIPSKTLQDIYKQTFPDLDLIYFKDECFNLPYERLGSMTMNVFRENFKTVKLFLATISCLIYSHNYFNELGEELSKMQSRLSNIRNNLDVTKILFTDTSHLTGSNTSASGAYSQQDDNYPLGFGSTPFQQPQQQQQNSSKNSIVKAPPAQRTTSLSKPSVSKGFNTNAPMNTSNGRGASASGTTLHKQSSQQQQQHQQQQQPSSGLLFKKKEESNASTIPKQPIIGNQSTTNKNNVGQQGSRIQNMVMDKLAERLRSGDFAKKLDERVSSGGGNVAEEQNSHVHYTEDGRDHFASNSDLSLSLLSRVSFRDMHVGTEFDERILDGLSEFNRSPSESKTMDMDIRRWQYALGGEQKANDVVLQNMPTSAAAFANKNSIQK